jgi:hypothetical protein
MRLKKAHPRSSTMSAPQVMFPPPLVTYAREDGNLARDRQRGKSPMAGESKRAVSTPLVIPSLKVADTTGADSEPGWEGLQEGNPLP